MRFWRRRSALAAVLDPPVNVRIVRADGRVIPLELTYEGTDRRGVRLWAAVSPFAVIEGDVLRADRRPRRRTRSGR
jgi:hypothetical protein